MTSERERNVRTRDPKVHKLKGSKPGAVPFSGSKLGQLAQDA